jgi:hypothetical protein
MAPEAHVGAVGAPEWMHIESHDDTVLLAGPTALIVPCPALEGR